MDAGPSWLADADADLAGSVFVVIGVPFDGTASFRKGACEGPGAIREASQNFEPWLMELGLSLEDVPVHDAGDVPEVATAGEVVHAVETLVGQLGSETRIPVLLGGEHTASEGAVRARAHPHGDLAVLVLDAHREYRQEYMGEPRSHACAVRRCSDVVGADRTAVLGVRSASKEELDDAREHGLTFGSADRVREAGLDTVLADLLGAIGEGPLYLSIDLDVLDPSHAPGVQNPEPWGLSPLDVRRVMDTVAPRLVGLDMMECAPSHDGGQTALVAARLLRHGIGAAWQGRDDNHGPDRGRH